MVAVDIALVGAGGGIGSLLRWWIGRLVGEKYHGKFPLSTFIINVSGAFIIGFLSSYFLLDWDNRYGSFLQSAILTGLLGGYTTFSSMQLDALKLTQTKQKMLALFYLLLSIIAGLIAAFVGAWLVN